jgi:putative sterol carrier protein
MYHDYPKDEQAYHCLDQYTFGSELIVAPYTRPADPETRMSRQVVWLPPGQWFHFLSGLSYAGDGWHALYGGLGDIPVFAKAGAIVPLAPKRGWGGLETPEALEVHVFPGSDNRFELYEDDGDTAHSLLPFNQAWEPNRLRFEIGAAQGESSHLPAQRAYTLLFREVAHGQVAVEKNGHDCACAVAYDEQMAVLTVGPVILSPADTLSVAIHSEGDELLVTHDHRLPNCRKLLRACRLDSYLKQALDSRLDDLIAHPAGLADYQLWLSPSIARALAEIIAGAGTHETIDPIDKGKRVILWNNQASTDVGYHFVGRPAIGWTALRRTGPLPKFGVIQQQGEQLKVDLGHGARRMGSVAEWFASLPHSFRPEKVGNLEVAIQFNLKGQDGLQAYAEIAARRLRLVSDRHGGPDLTIEADASDWLALLNGEVDPNQLFLSGKLQVSGDMALVMRLADWLGGAAEPTRFSAERWKLSVNLLDMLTLELGRPA